MASPTQTVRKTIGGRTYELRPWGYEDGERWVIELARVALAGMESARTSPDAMQLASGLLAEVKPETFAAFRATCCKYTSLVTREDDESETVIQLNAAVHLRGRYADALELIAAHIEREYADFFGELGDLLGRLFGGQASGPR